MLNCFFNGAGPLLIKRSFSIIRNTNNPSALANRRMAGREKKELEKGKRCYGTQ